MIFAASSTSSRFKFLNLPGDFCPCSSRQSLTETFTNLPLVRCARERVLCQKEKIKHDKHVTCRHSALCVHCDCDDNSDWLGIDGRFLRQFRLARDRWEVLHMKDPPSKMQMRPQRAVVGGGTSKSDVGSGKGIHAIRSSSLTHVFQLLLTSSCPRRPHHQLSQYSYFSISQFCR